MTQDFDPTMCSLGCKFLGMLDRAYLKSDLEVYLLSHLTNAEDIDRGSFQDRPVSISEYLGRRLKSEADSHQDSRPPGVCGEYDAQLERTYNMHSRLYRAVVY